MLLTALIAAKPQFTAVGEMQSSHHKDDRDNDVTEICYAKPCIVNNREYTFHAGTYHGIRTPSEFMAAWDRLGNELIFTCAMVHIEDIGAVSQWASTEFYTQTVEVCF